jgi:hypothetical protein
VLDESNMPDLLALRFVAELDYFTGKAKDRQLPGAAGGWSRHPMAATSAFIAPT